MALGELLTFNIKSFIIFGHIKPVFIALFRIVMAKLEICCFGIECAQVAQEYGADRIELCSVAHGGPTPSYGYLKLAKRNHIFQFILFRPRGGDFCYNISEFDVIREDLIMIRNGLSGAVIGILDSEGRIDINRMQTLMEIAQGWYYSTAHLICVLTHR